MLKEREQLSGRCEQLEGRTESLLTDYEQEKREKFAAKVACVSWCHTYYGMEHTVCIVSKTSQDS